MNKIAIFFAGGHARVVCDALRAEKPGSFLEVYDENEIKHPFWWNALEKAVLFPKMILEEWRGDKFHVAIGSNNIRRYHLERLQENGGRPISVVHPQATISPTATIGEGTFVAAGGILSTSCRIGKGVIINHRVSVDHDCTVGDFTHLAPGSVVCGGVTIGANVMLGAGATVLPGLNIGEGCTIGAGAVVTRDIPEGMTCVGIPAKSKSKNS